MRSATVHSIVSLRCERVSAFLGRVSRSTPFLNRSSAAINQGGRQLVKRRFGRGPVGTRDNTSARAASSLIRIAHQRTKGPFEDRSGEHAHPRTSCWRAQSSAAVALPSAYSTAFTATNASANPDLPSDRGVNLRQLQRQHAVLQLGFR